MRKRYQYVMASGKILASVVIPENDLRARVVGVAPVTQELGDVFNILPTSSEFVLASFVVDADQEGFLA